MRTNHVISNARSFAQWDRTQTTEQTACDFDPHAHTSQHDDAHDPLCSEFDTFALSIDLYL
jgi:hypothetical protein